MEKKQPIVIQESDKIQTIEVTTKDSIEVENFILKVNFIKQFPAESKFVHMGSRDEVLILNVLDCIKSPTDNIEYIKYSIKTGNKLIIFTLKIKEDSKPLLQETRISVQAIDNILAEIATLKSRINNLEKSIIS